MSLLDAIDAERAQLTSELERERDEVHYWQLMYRDERDSHTERLRVLTELREQVNRAIEDLRCGAKTETVIERLRRARVQGKFPATCP